MLTHSCVYMCRKVHNFKSVTELYKWSSCVNYLEEIHIPMIFINARDDPIVPDALLQPIRQFAYEYLNQYIYSLLEVMIHLS